MKNELLEWILNNGLNCTIENKIVLCGDKKFLLLEHKEDKIIDAEFELILTDEEFDLSNVVDYFLFKFGSIFYYSEKNKLTFTRFKYIGNIVNEYVDIDMPYLGVRGKYELCNGSRTYEDWCKKAKFCNYTTLAICEKNTMAGVLHFQQACEKENIKSIVGITLDLKLNDERYEIKLFVKNTVGWYNLLKIFHDSVKTDEQYITYDELKVCYEGLILVLPSNDIDSKLFKHFENLYYQFNPTIWSSEETDKKSLLQLKSSYNNKKIKKILISDSFYLDKEDYEVKQILNTIVKGKFQYSSKDQFFKDKDYLINSAFSLFEQGSQLGPEFVEQLLDNFSEFENLIDFKIQLGKKYLPEYEMDEEEKAIAKTNLELFQYYCEKNYKEKILTQKVKHEIYRERLDREMQLVIEGNVFDYFLILADICKWCRTNGIITGLGRGSAAGSLISHILGITTLDPIEHNLLFERFLNKGRLFSGALPDIDEDVPSNHRQDIINYVIGKYGVDQVACIGTSQNFKLKSVLKDALKIANVDFSYANFITSFFGKEYDFSGVEAIFQVAAKEPKLKELINKHHHLIELLELFIFQPRSFGIHAAAIVVVPKFREGVRTYIWDYVPVRNNNGQYVTEFEKEHIEATGLLKEDILGLLQLDKFMRMVKLVKANTGETIDVYNIKPNDSKVYDMFGQGITEDIFQFGSAGLKAYCKQLKPENVNELVATNALYRPGAMETNSHNKFVKMKFGEIEPDKTPYLEEITNETFGLFLFQEQTMLAYQKVAKCDLNEADDFRKVLTKLVPGVRNPKIEKYEMSFKEHYFNIIKDQKMVDDVWNKIVAFANYGFNKSHSASYAITGYVAQWFKCYHPLEFYVTALEFAKDDTIGSIIHEINVFSEISLKQPDINKSATHFTFDNKLNEIYWSLSSIKYVGEAAVENILNERQKNGQYFSFSEFLKRVKVNKNVVEYLILAGAFDTIEKIEKAGDRFLLLNQYQEISGRKDMVEKYQSKACSKEWWWQLKSREVCGYGFINYQKIIKQQTTVDNYTEFEEIQLEESVGEELTVAGIVTEIFKKTSKKGQYAKLTIDHNNDTVHFIIWPEIYEKYKEQLDINQLVVFKGTVRFDKRFDRKNTIYSVDKTFIKFI